MKAAVVKKNRKVARRSQKRRCSVLARIAAVQLDYLPAYFDKHRDCLASPLETRVIHLGDKGASNVLKQWRQELKYTYESTYESKLTQIVRFCASLKVDVVIFPEYSIPVGCLPMMKSLSERLHISIVAGTHRVDNGLAQGLYRSLSENDGPKIQGSMNGHAICPIFIQGKFDYIQKLTGSRYDSEVGIHENKAQVKWGLISFPCKKGHLNVRIFVCSDYLPSNRDRVNDLAGVDKARNFRATIVVSSTPSLGPFADRSLALESNDDDDARRAANLERRKNPVIFVNDARRGGTKIFYDLRPRSPEFLLLEDIDGSFGIYRANGPTVTSCGLQENAEGIVVVEAENSKEDTLDTRLVAVCPIVHCEGPQDSLVSNWQSFCDEYRGQDSLQNKKSFLSREDSRLARLIQLGKNPIFREKVQFLRDNIEAYSDELALDSMMCDFCIVSEEAPHKDSWIYRSSLASIVKLKEMREVFTKAKREEFERLLKDCEKRLEEVSTSPNLPSNEKGFREELIHLRPEELLVTSGTFYTLITRERSSVEASVNVAHWICHLLETHLLESETGVIEDVLRVIERIKEVRPYPAVSVLNQLQSLLEKPEENYINRATDYLRDLTRCHDEAKQRLSSYANRDFKLQKGEAILVFGYSEAVILLLEAITPATTDHLPSVVVTECRNRHNTGEGIACAMKIIPFDISCFTMVDL
jgi:hypothetical protein